MRSIGTPSECQGRASAPLEKSLRGGGSILQPTDVAFGDAVTSRIITHDGVRHATLDTFGTGLAGECGICSVLGWPAPAGIPGVRRGCLWIDRARQRFVQAAQQARAGNTPAHTEAFHRIVQSLSIAWETYHAGQGQHGGDGVGATAAELIFASRAQLGIRSLVSAVCPT